MTNNMKQLPLPLLELLRLLPLPTTTTTATTTTTKNMHNTWKQHMKHIGKKHENT